MSHQSLEDLLVSVYNETPTAVPVENTPTADTDKKKYIQRHITELTHNELIDIVQIIVASGEVSLFKESSEGCLLDLNKLNPATVNKMYLMIYYKLK